MNPSAYNQAMQHAHALLRSGAPAAVRTLEQIVAQFPGGADAWLLLGQVYGSRNQHEAARKSFVQATQLNPDFTAAWYNLGSVLLDLNRCAEAEQAFLQVLRFDTSAQIYLALGIAAQGANRYPQAVEYYTQAMRRGDNSFSLHLNLGSAYCTLYDYENALKHSLTAHRLDPGNSIAIHNIATCYLELAEIKQALAYYKQSSYPPDESNYLFALNFLENYDAEQVFREHKAWGDKAVAAAPQLALPARDTSPERRLKLGYLSADFHDHPVSIFLEHVLKLHDHAQFEIFCYTDARVPADAVTARLQGYADHWRDITQLDDRGAAEVIRQDGIDILVDLGGHAGARAHLMASRNAPVQVTYLGHVNTTGLSTVDYRLTDALLDPPGETDRYCVEKLIRLGNNFYTYNPPDQDIPVGPLPALSNGYITFASFNKLCKLNPRTIGLWARVMAALPGSRMLMVGRAISTDHGKALVARLFESFGIGAERLEFVSFLPLHEYFAIHNRVDLIMDCFPWNGHTTTMHSLWMGVPTLTIEGRHHAGRLGYAIMTNLGLPEFVAQDGEDFVSGALRIANDPHRLAEIRQGMRARLAKSVLADHQRLTRDIEANYRKMWHDWLANRQR